MLWITNACTANESISADTINEIGGGKVIVEANSKRSKTGFLTLRAKFTFAELR